MSAPIEDGAAVGTGEASGSEAPNAREGAGHSSGAAPGNGEVLSYEAAAARVEEIIRRLDSGEASLSETLALVTEGKTLIELCAAELTAVGGALEELRLDDLVARLEREASA
jgi:exodeoxyribonuclease VII small subunit